MTDKVEDNEICAKMKAIDQITTKFGMPKLPKKKLDKNLLSGENKKTIAQVDAKPVYFDEIAPGLNGVGRIIKYNNHSISKFQTDDGKDEDMTGMGLMNEKPENCEIVEMIDGEIANGKKNGYSKTYGADGSVEVGFFEDDLPKGKFVKFDYQGE